MNALDIVVVLAYATLLVEITVFPIPSEASTWQLLAEQGGGTGELQVARRRSLASKLAFFALPTAVGVAAWLVPLLTVVWPSWRSHVVEPGSAIGIVAMTAMAMGRGTTFLSVLQLRAARRAGQAPRGLFAWSRNPGLVGMYVCFAGLVLAAGMPLLWGALPFYVANMHVRVRLEEAHLRQRLGQAWADYIAAVPRYLPVPGLR